jgi:hypothetical protein
MRGLYATAALWATLPRIAPGFEASFASATDTPEKTVPQGQDPPGPDNGQQQGPPTEHKEVIPRLRLAMRTSTPKHRTRRLVMRRKSSLHLLHRRQRKSRAASLKRAKWGLFRCNEKVAQR